MARSPGIFHGCVTARQRSSIVTRGGEAACVLYPFAGLHPGCHERPARRLRGHHQGSGWEERAIIWPLLSLSFVSLPEVSEHDGLSLTCQRRSDLSPYSQCHHHRSGTFMRSALEPQNVWGITELCMSSQRGGVPQTLNKGYWSPASPSRRHPGLQSKSERKQKLWSGCGGPWFASTSWAWSPLQAQGKDDNCHGDAGLPGGVSGNRGGVGAYSMAGKIGAPHPGTPPLHTLSRTCHTLQDARCILREEAGEAACTLHLELGDLCLLLGNNTVVPTCSSQSSAHPGFQPMVPAI